MLKVKACSVCKQTLFITEFTVDRSSADGRKARCKACSRKASSDFKRSGKFIRSKSGFARTQHSAHRRGIPFKLTVKQYIKFWEDSADVCAYCDGTVADFVARRKVIMAKSKLGRFRCIFDNAVFLKLSAMTLDRDNPSIGYLLNNIKKACWICNRLKYGTFTGAEMRPAMRLIMQEIDSHRKKKRR